MQYQLKNEKITINVDSLGAELVSIVDNNGSEYLWCGDEKFWGRHSPVLFPFVGKPKNNQYRYAGKTYRMGQHGFARDMEFSCTRQEESEIWFALKATEETLEKYPFDFCLEIGYQLEANRVKVLWKVTNQEREKKMYFSIGAHPAFVCPFYDNGETQYALGMNAEKDKAIDKVTYGFLNSENGLLRDDEFELELENGMHSITEHFFDESAYVIENSQVSRVSLVNSKGEAYITVCFDAPSVGIWSPEKKYAPFVCIEPWYGRCDRESFDGVLEEREWGNCLQAGEIFEKSYDIYVGM